MAGLAARTDLQQFERPTVAGFRPAHPAIQARHGLGVVVEHLGSRIHDSPHRVPLIYKIGCEHFDGGTRRLAYGADAIGEVPRAAVRQIIAGDRRNDYVSQAQTQCGLRQPLRLVTIGWKRPAPLHGTEAAWTSADVAEDHEGGRLLRIALHAIRAMRVIADRFQA